MVRVGGVATEGERFVEVEVVIGLVMVVVGLSGLPFVVALLVGEGRRLRREEREWEWSHTP